MKIKFLTIAAMVAFAMTSCGGKSEKAADDAARESVAEQAENVSDPYADDVIADDVVVDDEAMFENIPGDGEAEKVASKSDVDAMLNEYERLSTNIYHCLRKRQRVTCRLWQIMPHIWSRLSRSARRLTSAPEK